MECLTRRDEIKFVVGDRVDYEWAREAIRAHALSDRAGQVLFSTVSGRLPPSLLVGWMLEDGLKARFQLQLHKYIWEPNQQGV